MPFLENADVAPSLATPMGVPNGLTVTPGEEDLNGPDKPTWNWGAAFRRNNEISALAASNSLYQTNEPEEGFNPWEKIKGTPDEANFSRLATARNPRMFDAIKSDIARENDDRKLLDGQPWWMGLLTEGPASILSPTTLLPGGEFVAGAKGGFALVKGAASVGLAAGFGTAAQEAMLHGVEQTRTGAESATAIGASVFLGGLLGAGGSALLSKGEWQKGVAALERETAAKPASEVYSDVFDKLKAAGVDDTEAAANAAIFQARYETRAQRLGGDAADLYRGENLEVAKPAAAPDDLAAAVPDATARTFNQEQIDAAIRAYHGSPHDFDSFDLSKIGTGEGAQAYGHGLYFAEREGVAKGYRDALSPGDWAQVDDVASSFLGMYDRPTAIKMLRDSVNDPTMHKSASPETYARAADLIEQNQPIKSPGKMYEVGIKADPEHFLDWDKPIGQQPEMWDRLRAAGLPLPEKLPEAWKDRSVADFAPRHPDIARKMADAGIPGIKYLDAGSRDGSGTGSRNFVVFDDKLVDIVRKYQLGENGPKAAIDLGQNRAVVNLFEKADASSFMHESSHLWLDEMVRDAARSDAPAQIKDDLAKTLKWLGTDDPEKLTTAHHEQWARGFEEYLRDGKAPSASLAKVFEQFKQWLTTIYKSLSDLGPDHVAISDDVRGVMDRMLGTDEQIKSFDMQVLDAAQNGGRMASVGAAANTATSLEDNSIAGRAAAATAAATAKMNPLLRALHSPSAVYRDVAMNLVENPLYLKKNMEGVASEPAAETLMKLYNAGLAHSLEKTNAGFLEYRKAGGALGKDEFRDAVGKAMRRGDTDADPVITKIAQEWRAKVFDPLKQQAIDVGLLPSDVSVDTAQSYFSRMWNSRAITADEQGFKGMVKEWVSQKMPEWTEQYDRGVDGRLNPLRQEIEAEQLAKLRRSEELKQRIDVADTSEMGEGDIRQALRIVQGGAPKPKGVKTLTQFVLDAGGLVDDAGELANRGITNKARPGLVRSERRSLSGNKTGGWTLDDMARHAWENGYFDHTGGRRPSPDEFVEALNDDFSKIRPVLKADDVEAYQLSQYVAQLEADLTRAGVDTGGKAPRFSTSEEMKGAVERVYKALDAEADRKITLLKDKLAEREVDARVNRESRFLGDPNEFGQQIADEVFDTLAGKAGTGNRSDFITVKARGPLKERTFNIPDLFASSNGRAVEQYLESDVEHVARRYTRVMGADVEIARKFGSVDMKDQIAKIHDDYRSMRSGITDEKQLLALGKREDSDIKDMESVRDLLRGTNPGSPADSNYSRVVRVMNHFNYLRSMGEVALASLSETVRPAMVHGLMPYMDTLGQTLTNLKGIKLSVAEANLAGNVHENVLGTRLATLSEIVDPYASRGPVEAFMENMTNIGSKWNGIRLLTDMQKAIASVMTQNRLLEGATRYLELASKERAYMAYMGVDQSMAERIAAQFAEHGETAEKVRVANTEKWTDEVARRTYRAAINKDVDSIITTKGVADTPSFANTPTGKMMLQFKSFALASHQRVLLRGLQEDQARFVGGLIAMTTIGMMATWLKAVSGNRQEKLQDIGKNPGWWIAEGFDKAGIFAVPTELANTFEKATGFNPIKTPMKAFDEGAAISQKNQNRSLLGSVVGPSAGLIDDATQVMGLPQKIKNGEDITLGQKNAAERLLPFNSYLGVRQMLRYVVNPQHP